jgi:hypothetical protein
MKIGHYFRGVENSLRMKKHCKVVLVATLFGAGSTLYSNFRPAGLPGLAIILPQGGRDQ